MNNLLYMSKKWLKWDKVGTIFAFLSIPVSIVLPILTAYTSKTIIDLLVNGSDFIFFTLKLGILIVVTIIITILQKTITSRLDLFQYKVSMNYSIEMIKKLLFMDYDILESYDGRYKFERCKKFAFEGVQNDGAWSIVRLTGLLTSVFGIITYSILFARISFLLLIIILGSVYVEYLIGKQIIQIGNDTESKMSEEEMKFSYIYRITADPVYEQEIHIQKAKSWLKYHLSKIADAYFHVLRKYTNETTQKTVGQALCALVRDAATFSYLIYSISRGSLQLGDFIFYFSLINGFSEWLNTISGHILSLKRITVECGKYREFIELENHPDGEENLDNAPIETIEFKHVDFGYDDKDSVLRDISFSIRKGERIAIVGENGAGKTTLIKLLCRFYSPKKGQVLINGKDINSFSKAEYLDCFRGLFQDYNIFPTTIYENIALDENYDSKSIYDILDQIGLSNKIDSLPNGLNTLLIKHLQSDSTDLSGGERQKLALARVILQDSQVLILDEPSSALDPIAEEKLYREYMDLTTSKISLFISHRLASTKFCDRIIYLHDGSIESIGTHEELLKNNENYRNMFDTQSQYYREEAPLNA